MNFDFTPEQQQFSDALRRWIDRDYTFAQRRKIIHGGQGVSDQAWAQLVELGVTALPIPEAQGGFNGSPVDMMVVMQELGRGMVVEPYFATMLAAEFIKRAGTHPDLLIQIAAGKLKMAAALHETQSRHELFNIAVSATFADGGCRLNGRKTIVLHGAQADMLIVSARSSGTQRELDGISLYVVPAGTAGITRHDYRTIDGMRAADITFDSVYLPASALLGEQDRGWEILDAACDVGATLLCSEAIGAMDALYAATLDYLKNRQQFGVPIGTFQVLQHRMADMFMQLEQARSITMLAAVKVQSADVTERRRAVSAAKARVGQALKFIGQQSIQLHGGMGVTDELPAAHLFKRLTMIDLSLGDTDHHLARFVAQPGFHEAAQIVQS